MTRNVGTYARVPTLCAVLLAASCGFKVPTCLLDGTCLPSPSPSSPASPAPSPEATPSASPSPTPSPIPSATPEPKPSPSASPDSCPAPFTVKLGFRTNPRQLAKGFRNMADVTPMVKGACAHKGQSGPEAICAVSEACGPVYDQRYGEPQAFQSGTGFDRAPVERASETLGYVLVMASNDPRLWTSGEYAEAGPMTVCVSFPNLDHWRCQHGEMGIDGKLYGFGTNDRGRDLPKR